ncbi:MAG: DNA recombination protein RmuC [Planctomycetota bacterium]|nr:MAG: DNA recombination protein RmuC [Planctomycetota bacterium]
MEPITWVLAVVAVLAVAAAAWLAVGRAAALARVQSLEESARLSQERADQSTVRVVELSEQLAAARQQLEDVELVRQELERNEQRLKDAFSALSAKALQESREQFIKQAEPVFDAAREKQSAVVKPIEEVLRQTREKLEKIESQRTESFARLYEKIEHVSGASERLRNETERLTRALSRPEIRGRYGEIQLRRVAELAGMTSYCDFSEQESARDDDGRLARPDMIVRLPNNRVIAVDAKTNTYAYLEAVNARDESEREHHLDRFATHVVEQARKLGDKKYWSKFDGSPEFVVMFVPGDHFIDAALSRRPELVDFAAEHNVILASPSTLIGLLRAVAVGWREHSLSEQARELLELGRELHDRAAVAFDHVAKLGITIRQSVERYNQMVGSIDTRLVPTLRKFEEAGARSGKNMAELKPVDRAVRQLESGQSDSEP